MNATPLPPAGRVREVLSYNPETGVFTWAEQLSNAAPKGCIAGGANQKGYSHICIDGRRFKAARLAWLYVTGEDPGLLEVDHKNRVRDDNRFSNLRLATRKQNNENIGVPRNSSSGVRGVHFLSRRNRWEAYIYSNKRRKHIGHYLSKEEAVIARQAAEAAHFTHHGIGTEGGKS